MSSPDERPVLTVIGGDASPDEIAALVAALAERAAAARSAAAALAARRATRPGPGWSDRSALLRKPLRHGPGAWQASGRSG